jgi:GGDEF domain-containing protein
MSLQGSLVVVAEKPSEKLVGALAAAGAFPVIEATPADAIAAIEAARPEAVVLADSAASEDASLAQALAETVTAATPIIPVIARLRETAHPAYREALPVHDNTLTSATSYAVSRAVRVRTLHAAILRRAQLARDEGHTVPAVPRNDPLGDAIVIVAGRGRTYPALTLPVGEKAGLIGALTIETAARYLKGRDVDGLVIGDGFSATAVDSLLTVLGEDTRFRDMPIGVLAKPGIELEHDLHIVVGTDPELLIAHLLPYVRLHAFEARLKRLLQSLEQEGMIDPDTGLLRPENFTRELERAIQSADERGVGLSVARFSFPDDLSERGNLDAARLLSRLVRGGDFGCRQDDGSILVTFAETDLQHAHVVARRLASILKHTMLSGGQHPALAPQVTLTARKPSDNVVSLLTRVLAPQIAA